MTEEQKKMKKYCNAVERRLNLPLEVKARVMSDFSSSIQARREAGQTDEEIYAELGTPKAVAAELNEQMKEYAYRKSPWRFLFLATAALSGGWMVLYCAIQVLAERIIDISFPLETSSLGIIGGADGPTSIFVTGAAVTVHGYDWDFFLMALILVVSILAFLRLRKCKRK